MTSDNFRQLVDDLPDLICRYRSDGLLLYVNDAYALFYGRSAESLVGLSFLELAEHEYRDEVERSLARVRRLNLNDAVVVNEHRAVDAQGRIRWQQWTDKGVFDQEGELIEIIAVGRDVTERRAAEEQATYLASHDSLTGLLNRRSVLVRMERLLANARRDQQLVGILYLDIDDFKSINDQRGHSAGDRVLEEASERMVASFRGSDLLARIGGDEFVIVCPSVQSDDQLLPLLGRLEATLAEPMLGLDGLSLTASVGWILSDGVDTAEDLLARADRAMYRSKARRDGETARQKSQASSSDEGSRS